MHHAPHLPAATVLLFGVGHRYDPRTMNTIPSKRCTRCRRVKPLADYYDQPRCRDGKHSGCKACMNAAVKASRKDPSSKARHHHYCWRSSIKRRYGMTEADYLRLLAAQDDVCAICGSPTPNQRGNKKHLHIDHCAKTGKVRGLLCSNCNNGLGRFCDSIELLLKAVAYLRANGHT